MPARHTEARNILFPEFRFVSQKQPPRYIELSTKPVPGTLQEGGAPFQTTHWTVVLQAGKADADESARKALAVFSETYWPPLYTFVRRRGYSPADAQDLVQGFFEHLLKQKTLSRADREKGRLRTFLLGSLQNFLLKQRERMSAMKRGGGQQIVSFDDQLIDAEAAMNATAHLSEVSSYDLGVGFQCRDARVEERAGQVCRRRQTGVGR